MSYEIEFRDKTKMTVADDAGAKLQNHLLTLKKPEYIEIAGDVFMSSQIVSIAKSFIQAQPAPHAGPRITGPVYNCGPLSIQLEVRRRLIAQHPKDWPKYLKSATAREKMRLTIRAEDPDRKYCDHHASIHVCQPLNAPVALEP